MHGWGNAGPAHSPSCSSCARLSWKPKGSGFEVKLAWPGRCPSACDNPGKVGVPGAKAGVCAKQYVHHIMCSTCLQPETPQGCRWVGNIAATLFAAALTTLLQPLILLRPGVLVHSQAMLPAPPFNTCSKNWLKLKPLATALPSATAVQPPTHLPLPYCLQGGSRDAAAPLERHAAGAF